MTQAAPALRSSLRTHVLLIVVVSMLLVIALGGWAATTEFSGAVIAPGQLIVDSNVKKVQHLTGGVVGELRVRDGVRVKAGDVLVRLDDIQTRANLAIVSKALDELCARQSRMEAERDDADAVIFPRDLLDRIDNPDVERAITGELRQYETRRTTRNGQKAQLRERIAQLAQEITGYDAQVASKNNQIEWIGKELAGVRDLWERKLIPYIRLSNLEREKNRLEGERGQLIASIAQARGKMTEIDLQITQIDQDMRTEVGRELAEIRSRTAEIVEKKVAAQDMLQRIDIRAPQDGVVHQLSVHTVGGVITPGEQIMLIVPEADALTIEARVQPQDVDQIGIGQPVVVRLSAFNQQTTPELNGEVSRVSADVSEEPKTGMRYYTIRIAVTDSELARLIGIKLVPGMPADTFIQTSSRTVMSFLLRPLWDQIGRAFRET
jgi:HlyD family secretion protein